ncbi:SIR2 family protein [Variovorax sp. NFACC27]|uniref:SIR2 family NAD-dependent protein deacylase n=1 Tax=unclassified Variovorax TaxID=663243 RepID=UPI000899B1D3|nr:SIR2-like domain-containing protein [Variovorax sp. NFACC28]SEG86021.1 SIR2-like domain-containing protein [Variovorax sp. NFACC29]SFD22674.1 SIR2-like domain-containing protein [Variovorax sp. NFACC26]SFG29494.1 SIR2-like domain-containing protein [Variovorax sp. NFACC27]
MSNTAAKRVSELPDYAALKKLAAGLWHQDDSSHGAAVMVGAGFSRAAAVTIDAQRKLPLWLHLSSALASDLGADAKADPLRLAEEYHAYFGKPALHDLIRREMNDAAWRPGPLHKSLLSLPWSDVLTTNWDSLLERAAAEVMDPAYKVILKEEDISSSSAPRIIKLHGTLDVSEDLVFTQEDYRKYPENHAAFVNLARQIFIENELCLLGFSGDDPNFLQWAGWVRDRLSTHARRIYLVGALNLTAAKRRYLESINIAPIDLGAIVSDHEDLDLRHAAATQIFLEVLTALKPKTPWSWVPSSIHRKSVAAEEFDKSYKDEQFAATLLERQLPVLISDRESYPGWLVCPSGIRFALQTQISDPYPNTKNLAALSPGLRAKLLYEIAWRQSITFEQPQSWLAEQFLLVCDPKDNCGLTKRQQLEIALLLLKRSIWFPDDSSRRMAERASKILEENVQFWPDVVNEISLFRAREARDRHDFPLMEKMAETISEADPVRKIQKAALLAECGRFEEGEKLIRSAFHELSGQYRSSKNSVYVLSRLAWATWLLRGINRWSSEKQLERFPANYQEAQCSPFDCMDYVQIRIAKTIEKQNEAEIDPSFEPGRYIDNSGSIQFSNELHPLLLLYGVAESVGIPVRVSGVNFLGDKVKQVTRVDGIDDEHRFSLAIRAANSESDDVLKFAFSRVHMARISQEIADKLFQQSISAIEYWRGKLMAAHVGDKSFALTKLRIFLEVLARVVVRASSEQAKQAFRLANDIARNSSLRHLWIIDALGHLVEYSLESIPESEHSDVLFEYLAFPLVSEINDSGRMRWPSPQIKNPGTRISNAAQDRRIDEIIGSITPISPDDDPALIRLLPLVRSNFLSPAECSKLADAVWGAGPVYESIPNIGLSRAILLELPSPNSEATISLLRRYLFERTDGSVCDYELLISIKGAAYVTKDKQFPTSHQALNYFDRLAAWRPADTSNDYFSESAGLNKKIAKAIGDVLSGAVVPYLSPADWSSSNLDKLCEFYSKSKSQSVLTAFVYFAQSPDENTKIVKREIRKGLQADDANSVASASYALLKWREFRSDREVGDLVSQLVTIIESGKKSGLPALLWTMKKMIQNGWLNQSELDVLGECCPSIFDSADYMSTIPSSRSAVSVSLLRAESAKLAGELVRVGSGNQSELERVLATARLDPLPEVRFAHLEH